MEYRREVDGLRAVAVIPVILFHAGLPVFGGGFFGVDIFFVISGYLITSLIVSEKAAGTFTLANFYERRARRILPALFVVMFACLPFAWLWLLPAELKHFSQSLVAMSGFASNVWFYLTSGYFDTGAELRPLLHTWSLSVEEQYYVLFPAFLLLVWKLGRLRIVALLALAAVLSFIAAQWIGRNSPTFTFFWLPTRGWELLVGALLAFGPAKTSDLKKGHAAGQPLSMLGLLLIFIAIFVYDRNTSTHGLYAVMASVGTALVIRFATQQTLVGRLLGSKPLVGIGLVSYSAYLWHQPLIAFARHRSLDEPTEPAMVALAVAALVLAYFSWKYVETPFRNRRRFSRKQIVTYAATGSLFFAGIGLVGYRAEGFSSRFSAPLLDLIAPAWSADVRCPLVPVNGSKNLSVCYFGDPNGKFKIALYGDSHAGALLSELDSAFKKRGIKGIRMSYSLECATLIPEIVEDSVGMEANLERCVSAFNKVLSYLGSNVDGIIVSNRWTLKMYPIAGLVDKLEFDNGENGIEGRLAPRKYAAKNAVGVFSQGADTKKSAIIDMFHAFEQIQKPIYLVYPVPEVGWTPPKRAFKLLLNGERHVNISTSHKRFIQRNSFVMGVLDSISDPNIIRIRPEDILCDAYVKERCIATLNGASLYFDDNHLSNAGARLVVDKIIEHLRL